MTDYIAPIWLTKNYLENILKNYKENNNLKILEFNIEPAIPKGSNYASSMLRIQLTCEYGKEVVKSNEKLSILVKSKLEGDSFLAEIQKPYQLFETEMAMYEKVLPKLSALLQQIDDENKLFANTIYVDYKNEAIIFEDLSKLNFILADRLIGMDLVEAKFVLRKLAKMHAAAAVLNEQTQGSLEQFTRGIFNRHTRNLRNFFENVIAVCAEYAGNCSELGQYYKKKLLKLKAYVMEFATRAFDLNPGNFHTLIHGDIWINNIMIRYKNNNNKNLNHQIDDALLIDFQFSCWSSPVLDLHYFFNTSLKNELRLKCQDELVYYYYGILKETLLQLKFTGRIPSLHEICIDMEARRFHAVVTALTLQALMINDNNEDADLLACHSDDERGRNFRKLLYRNKAVQENAKKLLPYFDKHGLLDVNF